MSDDTKIDDPKMGTLTTTSGDSPNSQTPVEPEPNKRKIRLRQTGKRGPRTIRDLSERQRVEALTLRAKGVDSRTIAVRFGVNEKTLWSFFDSYKDLLDEVKAVREYREHRPDLLAAAHSRLLKVAVSNKKLDEAPLGQIAVAMDKLHKAERLERGQSTDNQSIRTFTTVAKEDGDNKNE